MPCPVFTYNFITYLKTAPAYIYIIYLLQQDALTVTGTFKQMKMKLSEEGFNPTVIREPLFFLEENQGYIPMTQEIFTSIAEGRIRL